MAADPDRIRDIEAEQARRERNSSGQPKRSFATALEEEPLQRDDDPAFAYDDQPQEPSVKRVVRSDEDNHTEAEDETQENGGSERAFRLAEDTLGKTISSAELHHQLMRFKR